MGIVSYTAKNVTKLCVSLKMTIKPDDTCHSTCRCDTLHRCTMPWERSKRQNMQIFTVKFDVSIGTKNSKKANKQSLTMRHAITCKYIDLMLIIPHAKSCNCQGLFLPVCQSVIPDLFDSTAPLEPLTRISWNVVFYKEVTV